MILHNEEYEELIATIKSETKIAPNIDFPSEDMEQFLNEVNNILQRKVTEILQLMLLQYSLPMIL